MAQENPVKFRLIKPIVGNVRAGDRTATWEVSEIECRPIASNQAPPSDDLVFAAHRRMRDGEGNAVPVEVLAVLDLQAGFREAYSREVAIAWAVAGEA